MAEREVPTSPAAPEKEQTSSDPRRPALKPAIGLPAGIRWWEACGGWNARYALGAW